MGHNDHRNEHWLGVYWVPSTATCKLHSLSHYTMWSVLQSPPPTPILSLITHIFLIISQTTLETPTEQQREKDTQTDFLQNSCWHSEAASTFFSGYSPRGNIASGIHPIKASSHIKGSPHAQKKLVREASGALPGSQSQPSRRKEKSSQVTA